MTQAWDGLKGEDMTEVYSRIGPSLGYSPRSEQPSSPKVKRQIGYVRRYYDDRRFGFIGREEGPDVHFHISAVQGAEKLRTGSRVKFEIGADKRGKPTARNVSLVRWQERRWVRCGKWDGRCHCCLRL